MPRLGIGLVLCFLFLSSGCTTSPHGLCAVSQIPWPAEIWQKSTSLTPLDPLFSENLSGAHWNPATQTLFVVTDYPGYMWRLHWQDGAFDVVAKYSIPGDLEAVTQADYYEDMAYVLDEKGGSIHQVRWLDDREAFVTRSWSLRDFAPSIGRSGPEGMVFIPDSFLQEMGFLDGAGCPRLSRNGMGGLMFVAHQVAGKIYVFDLAPYSSFVELVGVYFTSRSESSGLAFDRENNLFYIWHNTDGNVLEQASLVSEPYTTGRKFKTIQEITGPKTGNFEGIALGSFAKDKYIFFMCDDESQEGYGLMFFQNFPQSSFSDKL